MFISIFELFSIGIGPSSSHTVGPMRAANAFVHSLKEQSLFTQTISVRVDLYGSLALTGKGHGTDVAILNGLEGRLPDTVVPEQAAPRVQEIFSQKALQLGGEKNIAFDHEDLVFHYDKTLPLHANGMCFTAMDRNQSVLAEKIYYSIGGGFIVDEASFNDSINTEAPDVPYPFSSAEKLFEYCVQGNCGIDQIMLANEATLESESVIKTRIMAIAQVMFDCIDSGCSKQGQLPGVLKVHRRAHDLYQKLINQQNNTDLEHVQVMKWINVYAMAVNEENASGGRIVTAPTNGAAGIIPAVLRYYRDFCQGDEAGIIQFLLTAGAIAILYKKGASISAAEVGCQGEVGVACSMAAAALTAVLGGSLAQIEKAAEIGMEHHLGLTCDPVAGLVQVPCIERNAVAAVQAVNIAHLVLAEEKNRRGIVSLDKVIATMLQTGRDMNNTYKETSQGGLAVMVNLPEC